MSAVINLTRERVCLSIAAELCRESGFAQHPNAKARAVALGLHLWPRVRDGAELQGDGVYYDRRLPVDRQQELVGLCVATYGLRRHGYPEDAATIERIAALISGQRRAVRS